MRCRAVLPKSRLFPRGRALSGQALWRQTLWRQTLGPLAAHIVLLSTWLDSAVAQDVPAPAGISAPVHVVVLEFRGWKGEELRQTAVSQLATAFSDDNARDHPADLPPIRFVPLAQMQEASGGLEKSSNEAALLTQVSTQLNVDIYLRMEITGQGNSATTAIRLYDARGVVALESEEGSPSTRDQRTALGKVAVDYVLQMAWEIAQRRDLKAKAAASKAGPPSSEPSDKPPTTDREKHGEKHRVTGNTADPSRTRVRPLLFEGRVGPQFQSRDASLAFTDNPDRNYSIGLFSQIYGEAVVRPFAHRFSKPLEGLFVKAAFAHSIGVDSTVGESPDPISTRVWEVQGRLGYAYHFLENRLDIGGYFGFLYDVFNLGSNEVFPSSQYAALNFGLTARYSIVRSYLGLRADLGYRLGLGLGDLGEAYGAAGAPRGLDFSALLGGGLPVGFLYGVRVGIVRYNISLSGGADVLLASSGWDNRLTLQLLAGWAL